MLSNNIRQLRQQRGYTQEALAEKLHVVRQTVSKWEKGLSVPDADMLIRLAEAFEVPVAALLGAPAEAGADPASDAIAAQLAQINEQLAIRNRRGRRVARTVAGIAIGIIVFWLLLIIVNVAGYRAYTFSGSEVTEETVIEAEE